MGKSFGKIAVLYPKFNVNCVVQFCTNQGNSYLALSGLWDVVDTLYTQGVALG
jgi:hypothetical protein